MDVIEGEISVLQREAAPRSWELTRRWMEWSEPHAAGKPQGPAVLWGPSPPPAAPARERLNPPDQAQDGVESLPCPYTSKGSMEPKGGHLPDPVPL